MKKWPIFKSELADTKQMFANIRMSLKTSPLTAEEAQQLYARIDHLEEEKRELEDQIDDFRGVDRLLDVITQFCKKYSGEPMMESFALRMYEAWSDNTRIVAIRQMYESDIAEQALRKFITNDKAATILIRTLKNMEIPEKGAKYQELVMAVRAAYATANQQEFSITDKHFMMAVYNNLKEEAKKAFVNDDGKVVIRRMQDAFR